MKLISLDLKNFRQHIDSTITFADGVTGIIGPNGSGKSTVLEALAWALYGAPAVRGTNDTIRTKASEGGAKVNVTLTFELGGSIYKATRTLDGNGRSGSAVLEIDGRPLRSGMSEVSEAIAKLLGMDYKAFFTSFFTGQKALEFMAAMDGRARAAAIGKMLGYDRVTKSRDKANEDRKGLNREIEGLQKGLADSDELKERKKTAQERLAAAKSVLEEAEKAQKRSTEVVDKLKPVKEASDQKAKRFEEVSRRLEVDQADIKRSETRLSQLQVEHNDLNAKQKEYESIKAKLTGYRAEMEEYRSLTSLQKYETQRSSLNGQLSTVEAAIKQLESRLAKMKNIDAEQIRTAVALSEAEKLLVKADQDIQAIRESRIAAENSLSAQIAHLESQKADLEAKRAKLAEAGPDGKCPTCERELAGELDKVLANFDSQIRAVSESIGVLSRQKQELESEASALDKALSDRARLASEIMALRDDKTKADSRMSERDTILRDIEENKANAQSIHNKLDELPKGFDQTRFEHLRQLKESLEPERERGVALRSTLERLPTVGNEITELNAAIDAKNQQIAQNETVLAELAFSPEDREKLIREFDAASADLNASALQLERQRGELNIASALLSAAEREEDQYKSKLDSLKEKSSERLHLEIVAQAMDRLRGELNDRIRPELEAIASDLLSTMTDGRYNVIRIGDDYKAVIVDDGEEKPVISGGEDDIVNLALRLAISQMIADRAGQSFSLLVLDEVFGSLDDVRRDNVVSLLQNLKNRFEQIILITHVESIHDAVDNCLWVLFDERTKTSRLIDRIDEFDQPQAGVPA